MRETDRDRKRQIETERAMRETERDRNSFERDRQ